MLSTCVLVPSFMAVMTLLGLKGESDMSMLLSVLSMPAWRQVGDW